MQASFNNTDSKHSSSTHHTFSPLSVSKSGRLRPALVRVAGSVVLAAMVLGQPVTASVGAANSRTAQALPSTGAPLASQYFAPTDKAVKGDFLGTYNKFGLARIGYPLSEEKQENGRTVQYFERVRMESHAELANKGYTVLMTRLGVDLSNGGQFPKVAPFSSTRTNVYVGETGHSLAEPFLTYWRDNGGIELFGYPISEPVMQDGLKVQWFERARFEYHPELAASGQSVQLSLLGRQALEKTGAPLPVVNQANPASAAAAPAAPAAAQVSLTDNESYLLKAINEQRAGAGLPAVQLNGAITNLARARSNDMAQRNYFSHTTPEGDKFLTMLSDRGIGYKYAGEILARNNYPDDQATQVAMDSYLNSHAHKAIIFDGRYNLVGIGWTKSDEDEMHYFTVIFVQQ